MEDRKPAKANCRPRPPARHSADALIAPRCPRWPNSRFGGLDGSDPRRSQRGATCGKARARTHQPPVLLDGWLLRCRLPTKRMHPQVRCTGRLHSIWVHVQICTQLSRFLGVSGSSEIGDMQWGGWPPDRDKHDWPGSRSDCRGDRLHIVFKHLAAAPGVGPSAAPRCPTFREDPRGEGGLDDSMALALTIDGLDESLMVVCWVCWGYVVSMGI